MGAHTVIAAALPSIRQAQQSQPYSRDHWPPSSHQPYHDDVQRQHERQRSYGTMQSAGSSSSSPLTVSPVKGSPNGNGPGTEGIEEEGDEDEEVEEYEEVDVGFEPVIDVTWRYMSRIYLLVPVFTLLVFVGLVLLVTFAWPPSRREHQAGQSYPHPILPWPFLTGLFASVTVQSLRVPVYVIVSWLPISPRLVTLISTILHSILHELLRLATLPMIRPSPTSGFHSSYYLGLGWGAAEVTWGIVQGWDQLSLYQDVMRSDEDPERVKGLGLELGGGEDMGQSAMTEREDADSVDVEELEEAELERRVEILERMRARRDLERVIGVPFPNIPFPFHLLWRLDTLLLNLGLTLILSAYYFNSYPIYRHSPFPVPVPSRIDSITDFAKAARPGRAPSPYMWLVWSLVAALHVSISLVWKIVGRVGIGAVTWGGLIVSLGSVFAGLGGWGGLL